MAALAVRPLTAKNWDDIEVLFNAKGCSIPRWCWCVHYRFARATMPKDRKAALKRLAKGDPPPGLIAYRSKTPVGWVSLGPREAYARLATSPVMKPVDDEKVWSIVCFVVPPTERGHGIAHALLDGAIRFARKRKVKLLEGYPIDKQGPSTPMSLWFGTASMFAKQGFTEAARRKPTRPVMRLALT